MPRKKTSETANAEAEQKSAKTTSSESESTAKTTRRRRTADDILKEAVPESTTTSKESKAKKPAASKKVEADLEATSPSKAAPKRKPVAAKPTTTKDKTVAPSVRRKTLAEELEEEKKSGVKPTRAKKVEPEAVAPRAKTVEGPKKTAKPAKSTHSARKQTSAKSAEPSNLGFDRAPQIEWRSSGSAPKPRRSRSQQEDPKESAPEELVNEVAEVESAIDETHYDPIDLGDDQGRLKILTWRGGNSDTTSSPQLAPRRSKNRRRKEHQDEEFTAASALSGEAPMAVFRKKGEKTPIEPEPEVVDAPISVEPPRPVRNPIPRSEDAAQVVFHEGHCKIIKDKVVFAPFMFFAGPLEGKSESRVSEQIKLAAEHGVTLFMLKFNLEVGSSGSTTLKSILDQVSKLKSFAPDAQVVLRLNFVSAEDWKTQFPDAVDPTARTTSNLASLTDDDYWRAAETSLAAVIKGIRESKVCDAIMGVHLDRDGWNFDPRDGHDTSNSAQKQFRQWLRMRYRNDIVTLRAAWYDGKASFETIEIPEPVFTENQHEFVRTDRRARRWIDYHLFLADTTVERIGELCYTVKQSSEGDYLAGVTYGATFESSHPASGQVSLGKLLRCPELDYISGQSDTDDSAPGQTAGFPFPVDSFALNGKMFLLEERYRTPISGSTDDDDNSPVMKTPQALEAVHWRDAGAAMAHGGGVIWCDQDGKAWLNSRGIWERAGQIRKSLLQNLAVERSAPEVAVFIDERSLTYLADERSFDALVHNVRESVLRSGLSIGFYLLSDLAHRENFPESKLYVFVNAWDMRPEVRSSIKSRLQRDNKVLFWLYTAGLFEAGRDSLERVREVTGIALRPQPFNSKSGTTILNTKDPLGQALPSDLMASGCGLEPSFFAIPEDGGIIAEYTSTGLPSLLVKPFRAEPPEMSWTSVFLGEPIVTPAFFRALGQMAGCHVWNFEDDVVHAAAPTLTIHCTETGSRTLTLPNKWVAYNMATNDYMPVENNTVRFKAMDGSTSSFIVGTIGDVQSVVKADTDAQRKITSPIIRDENTLHWDTVRFDVEIMKLDEWVEESWSDEMADDLLLKPSMLEVDSDALMEDLPPTRSDASGRRRQRKRRGNGRRPSGEGSNQFKREDSEAQAETQLGVLFRKRD